MRKHFRRRHALHVCLDEAPEIVRLWALRMLVDLGASAKFLTAHGFEDDDIARWLGLTDEAEESWDEEEPWALAKRARSRLESMLQSLESTGHMPSVPEVLHDNVRRLAELLGLTPVECRLLEFAVLLRQQHPLQDVATYLGDLTVARLVRCLAVVLDIPVAQVNAALSPQGGLIVSGLLSVDMAGSYGLSGKLELLSGLADKVAATVVDLPQLLRESVTAMPAPTLTLQHYAHLGPLLGLLIPYLRCALEQRRVGVNILLYGPPGTGKSELARVLAHTLNAVCFEVSSEDEEGDALSGEQRVQAYRATQGLFGKQGNTLVVFDEIEDIFDGDWPFLGRKGGKVSKGWLNRSMESNPAPTIWLSNSVQCLDAAYIRRFDIVHEMAIPKKGIRKEMIQQACEGLLDEHRIACLAESEKLAPAVVSRAAAVVRQAAGALSGVDAISEATCLLIDNTLRAQGHKAIAWHGAARLPAVYDPAFINADQDVPAVVDGLARAGSARLCFYGPPGTGKTALARWLAQQLDMRLHVLRASDLLSMYVGGSEQNIAKAFQRAEDEGAVLLIDEVDSFLQDRNQTQRSWEVTLVNEMLTQMESYPGIFIASTNLMGALDPAALRRFDMKVRFDYLRPEQAWQLFKRCCASLGLEPGLDVQAMLAVLPGLTPGDYAAVLRQTRFHPVSTAMAFMDALRRECAVKGQGISAKVGFV